VLVTHDPEEAALLADEILVVDDGQLLQAGRRADVYNRPASPQVARLLGIQNLGHGAVTEPGAITAGTLRIAAETGDLPAGSEILWTIRPDHIAVAGGGAYPAIVADVADIGTITMLTLRLPGGPELRVRTTDPGELQPGDACRVDLDPAAITIWPSGASAHSLSTNPA
jgi:molybdate transport system permease protein